MQTDRGRGFGLICPTLSVQIPAVHDAQQMHTIMGEWVGERNNALHARPSVWVSIALQIFNNAQGEGCGGVGMLAYP